MRRLWRLLVAAAAWLYAALLRFAWRDHDDPPERYADHQHERRSTG